MRSEVSSATVRRGARQERGRHAVPYDMGPRQGRWLPSAPRTTVRSQSPVFWIGSCIRHHRGLARLVYASASVRETQKVKGFQLPFPTPLTIFDGKSPELYQARLFRMQFQPGSLARQ